MGSREVIVTYMSHVNEAGSLDCSVYVVFSKPFPRDGITRVTHACQNLRTTRVYRTPCAVVYQHSCSCYYPSRVSLAAVFVSHLYLLSTLPLVL